MNNAMKKLIYSTFAMFCVALTFTSCGKDDTSEDQFKKGSKNNPYSVAEAINLVANLTWTSLTEYDKTNEVCVKGKISRISNSGTFAESGTYGNASFYISDDGNQNHEFFCYRILYLGNKKYMEGQTDIELGDEVVICGKLMNYKNNMPETVAGEAYLLSILITDNGNSGSGSEYDKIVSFFTNSNAQTWTSDTDSNYGSGYSTTTQGLKIGYYKHTGNTTPVVPNSTAVRIYKNSVLCIATTNAKKIKKIVIGCAPSDGTSSYCFDMTCLEGGANTDAYADKSALTVTWTGSASKVVLQANNGQIRMEKLTVEFE